MSHAEVVEDARPYRPNVGIALFNAEGLVFAGRTVSSGPEVVVPGFEIQMPQGGIDPGEDIVAAARRELFEETGVRKASLLAATDTPWRYDFPPYDGPPHKLTAFRGQEQRWVALRFEGMDSDIDLSPAGVLEPVEFTAWGWFPLADLPGLVVPYKRVVYQRVVEAFGRFSIR